MEMNCKINDPINEKLIILGEPGSRILKAIYHAAKSKKISIMNPEALRELAQIEPALAGAASFRQENPMRTKPSLNKRQCKARAKSKAAKRARRK